MKISVITPVYNGEATIRFCIDSVLKQDYPDVEHIIIDAVSTDKTVEILQEYPVKWISEKDTGLYDAFNKGIQMATGDIVCFLGSDDFYDQPGVLQLVARTFTANPEADIVYGDIVYVKKRDITKITRYWKSSPFRRGLFRKGWLPPNTALFIKRSVFNQHGYFNLKFKLAADYELQYRFFELLRLKAIYVPGIMVRMRSGGVSNSNWKNIYKSLKECYQALRLHHVRFPLIFIINTLFYRLNQVLIPTRIKKSEWPDK
jgi:glycosyltransferase involved in cell wall biosynthesis